MKTLTVALITGALLLGAAGGAYADETTLLHHDGTSEGTLQNLARWDAEAARFTAEHACLVKRIRMWLDGPGAIQVHVWGDNGGMQPDLWKDRMEPLEVEAPAEGPLEIDLPGDGVRIEALEEFFVGFVHLTPSPSLLADTHDEDAYRGLVNVYDATYDKRLWFGMGGTYLVEVDVEWIEVQEDGWYTDVTEAAGVVPGSRPSWADYDGDGDPDLCWDGRRLYRNDTVPGGEPVFVDVTEEAGFAGQSSNGAVWADYDNDGDLDFYATVSSFQSEDPERHDRLWRNEGDGTFTDVSEEAGAPYDDLPTEAAAWADVDNDGWVDLYVANYEEPGETLSRGTRDILWKNNGDGTFRDATAELGMVPTGDQCGRGLAWADFDRDGDMDLYVSNYRLDPNFLWVNGGDGSFTEEAAARGVRGLERQGAVGHTIGSAWGDLDNDGDLDLVTANLAHPRFIEFSDVTVVYENLADGEQPFARHEPEATGVAYAETHSNAVLGDVDNDGDLDLHITSVYPERRSFLYLNRLDEGQPFAFRDGNYESKAVVYNGWGAAFADFDGDGDLDLATRRLLLNGRPVAADGGGRWLKVRLEGAQANRAAIGAQVELRTEEGTLLRQVAAGVGTGCQEPLTLHFGLGAAWKVEALTVRWPGGGEETLAGPFGVDAELRLVQGQVVDAWKPEPVAPPEPVVEPGPDVVEPGPDTVESGADVVEPREVVPFECDPHIEPDVVSTREVAGADAASEADTGQEPPAGSSSSGGCATGSTPASPWALLLLLLLLLLLALPQARARYTRQKYTS